MVKEVQATINAMPPGSAAGLDGVRPMHLQQLTSKKIVEAGRHLILALTVLYNCAAVGKIPDYFTTTHDGHHEHIIVKLDIANAFNSGSRKAVLEEVIRRFPTAMPLVSQTYSQPILFQLDRDCFWSQWGIQQGDPMGSLLMALAMILLSRP
ncbi:hypothetical protein Pmani_012825 [Petrolisthes manimaculis]|uniref:Reverse transcriptase n=1 Tax=Petrolisthes manimaculis TaxID=1843537 RepID=A0AAE1UCU6_9EUCA|nr:hypothetical protein Pmani_012825 [Petrolisthes manimaculis]